MSEACPSSNSVQTIVTSLIANGVMFLAFIAAFILLRPKNKLVYDPRVYSKEVTDADRPRELPKGYFTWLVDLLTRPDSEIIRDAGLDGYFFLRYLRFLFYIAVLGMILLMPILLPVNATNGANCKGFDLLAYGNITNHNRYYAHALLSWLFYGLVLFFIYREFLFYVGTRQAVLTSESQKYLLSNRTILINDVPNEYLTEDYLMSVFSGVKHVFISRDASDLADAVKERAKLYGKLEGTETSYIKGALKAQLKQEKKASKKGTEVPSADDINNFVKKQPTHRLGLFGGKLPFGGKKVETLPYLKEQIPLVDKKIEKLRDEYKNCEKRAAAFLVFNTQYDAEVASQMLPFHRPLQMSPRSIGVLPSEVIWENMNMRWWRRLPSALLASSFCVALVVFWAIPVAFAGFISQISHLIELFPWLSFLHQLPTVLYGLISSLLPLILLSVLMMLLPIVIRKAARLAGAPTQTHVEYYTQQVYFGFQVVQVFFVMSLSSSILAALHQILDKPSEILSFLQRNLPQSSNIFIAYLLLQGLTIPGGMLLQIVGVILYYVFGIVLDNTPRKIWARQNSIGGPGWGTVYPVYSNLALIMFVYAIISPLILPFAATLFLLVYIAFLNNLIFCTAKTNGRGIYYARGLQHLFVGIYISQLILVVLFVFSKSWGPLVLEVVVLLFTIWFQMHLKTAIEPLLFALPKSLLEHQDHSASASISSDYKSSKASMVEDPFQGGETTTLGKESRSIDQPLVKADSRNTVEQPVELPPKGGFWDRLFRPHVYYSPHVLRTELLKDSTWNEVPYTVSEEDEATVFNDPAMTAGEPMAWFPKDPNGWSKTELADLTECGVSALTQGSWFEISKKNKPVIKVSDDISEIPVYEKPTTI